MSGTAAAQIPEPDENDGRAYVRLAFRSTALPIRMGKRESTIRLKDLSRGGLAGMVEMPLAVGDYLIVVLDAKHAVEAQVKWVRRVMIGVQFTRPVQASVINRLYRRHVEAAKAEAEAED